MTAKITRTAVMRSRQCQTCGVGFLSRSSKKKFCDPCRLAREREADRVRADAKARAGGVRKVGSRVVCVRCSAPFTLRVGSQKFCPKCADERFNRWHREKRKSDLRVGLSGRISRGISGSLLGRKGRVSWRRLVDFSLDELEAHLERQFLPGMGWHNRDRWHIDHIVPLSSFEFDGPDHPEFKAAWALTNLRPLWKSANQRKSAKKLYLL